MSLFWQSTTLCHRNLTHRSVKSSRKVYICVVDWVSEWVSEWNLLSSPITCSLRFGYSRVNDGKKNIFLNMPCWVPLLDTSVQALEGGGGGGGVGRTRWCSYLLCRGKGVIVMYLSFTFWLIKCKTKTSDFSNSSRSCRLSRLMPSHWQLAKG